MLDNRKSNKITSTKDVIKMKQSKANDLTAILNGKKINNVTQDVLKSFDDTMTLKDVLAKLDAEKLLANTSNRTSSKSTEVMIEFKTKFDELVTDFVKSKKFAKDDKNRVTCKNVDDEIRIPKMYYATSKKK
jgi:cephalosporin hydroxylase